MSEMIKQEREGGENKMLVGGESVVSGGVDRVGGGNVMGKTDSVVGGGVSGGNVMGSINSLVSGGVGGEVGRRKGSFKQSSSSKFCTQTNC